MPLDKKSWVNLPKTDFPMKANLPQNEPKMLERWQKMDLYGLIRESRRGAPQFVLHDGPPYANGPIHLGTALNKTLKDFVVKTKTMAGFDSPYIPGWDCHGLPIEIKVDEQLGKKKLEMPPLSVRKACRAYAEKFVDLQRSQFRRMGVFGRWDDPYLTMSPRYEAAIVEQFYGFFEKGAVYKGLRPVYWCIRDQTALAEAEVEYEDHTSPSIYVRYRLTSPPEKIDPALAGKQVSTIIWTTTPWTLPASLAIAFHPDEEYVALATSYDVFIVAEKLVSQVTEKAKLGETRVLARFPGRKLEYATFAHPFLDRQILGVLADYVTMDQGTGAVHTAPAHGADDFYTGQRYGLPQTCNVDSAGRMRHGQPEYEGKTVFEANEPIVEVLRTHNALLHVENITHSYPHCWRCHQPVIFRATEQWFIGMEKAVGENGATLRARTLDEIKKVKWDPAWGEERMANMIATRPDWCISRQRVWGVPIAVIFCEKCTDNAPLSQPAVRDAIVSLFRERGSDAWFELSANQIVPQGTACPKCGSKEFRKENDIIDVWFESGSSFASVLGHDGLPFPSDVYLEGSDQFRGWFQSSLLISVGTRNQSPYHGVVTPGWTLDENREAMSKSRGNDVDPVDIAGRLGSEIVRLWVASVDFREDVVGSERLMQRIADNYRKIRNTFKFLLGNLFDFDPARHSVAFDALEPLDLYMLLRTESLAEQCKQWYTDFEFHKVYHEVHNFCVVDLSAVYLDILKDRLYTFAPHWRTRRSAQTAVWRIAEALVRLLAPIMTFTADEIWQYLPRVAGRVESVHLAVFPRAEEITGRITDAAAAEQVRSDWTELMGIRGEVLKALEEARAAKLIGGSLEAALTITADGPSYQVLHRYEGDLRALFIVSGVHLVEGAELNVTVSKAPGRKCERCWNYSIHVGEDPVYPNVCERCSKALADMEQVAAASNE
ncbi:MAG TPA: isoleucine--tRNA ligase [Terriglobales bacterium]|nr:isoleucine--tRNA ligase [Terriglobales bacterium]